MSEQIQQPLEETPEVASAVADDVAVPQFITGGGPDDETPEFLPPPDEPSEAADETSEAADDPTAG